MEPKITKKLSEYQKLTKKLIETIDMTLKKSNESLSKMREKLKYMIKDNEDIHNIARKYNHIANDNMFFKKLKMAEEEEHKRWELRIKNAAALFPKCDIGIMTDDIMIQERIINVKTLLMLRK